MDIDRRKLSDYSIQNLLEKSKMVDAQNEIIKPTTTMPSFIIKYKLRLPPAPAKVSSAQNFHTRIAKSSQQSHQREKWHRYICLGFFFTKTSSSSWINNIQSNQTINIYCFLCLLLRSVLLSVLKYGTFLYENLCPYRSLFIPSEATRDLENV